MIPELKALKGDNLSELTLQAIKILLIDDEPGQMELTKINLEMADPALIISIANNPSDALKMLQKETYDCIVSDYIMPGMNGIQLYTEIKKTKTIPFIIYTARGSDEVAASAFDVGIDDYVQKQGELAHYKVLAKRIRHITEKCRAENDLKISDEKFNILYANMLDGFAYCKMIYDESGKPEDFIYLEVNDAFERLTGLKKTQVLGRRVSEAIPGTLEANPEIIEVYGRVSSSGLPEVFEVFFKPLNNWFSISVYSPEKGYFVAVFDNITQRKNNEALLLEANKDLQATNVGLQESNVELATARNEVQDHVYKLEGMVENGKVRLHESEERLHKLQQMDTISRIGAVVAHDLRGPLVTISQASEMAKAKQELSDKMLELISDNARRSLEMIEEFREGTREVKVLKRMTDLSSLVKQTVEEVPHPGNVTFDLRLGEGLNDVSVDPGLIRRVLVNLVQNGLEAMSEGGRLTVVAKRVEGNAVIEVGDTGVGIREEDKRHIFEPLFTRKAGGLGLGLYFVQMAAYAHGGVVSFESKVGEGTTFKMHLPVV